jgi:hypothetical protein
VHPSEEMPLLPNMGSQDDWVSASLGREQYYNDPTKSDEEQDFCPSARQGTKDPP